jgi:F-type H+-transporting ATPase subunit epsilon
VTQPFELRLLTPYKSVFEDKVEAVILPGENGEFGVLASHTKFVTTLKPGVIRYVQAGETHKLTVSGGFAEVHSEGVTVLADSMEQPEKIDRERAELSRNKTLEALKDKPKLSEKEISRLEDRLARAENRLRVSK